MGNLQDTLFHVPISLILYKHPPCNYHIYLYFLTLLGVNVCNQMSCEHKCINTNGSFLCQCNAGYVLNADKRSCDGMLVYFSLFYCLLRTLSLYKDINECAANAKLCSNGSSCVNTNGSYICQCSNGYPQLNGTCKSKEYIILNLC